MCLRGIQFFRKSESWMYQDYSPEQMFPRLRGIRYFRKRQHEIHCRERHDYVSTPKRHSVLPEAFSSGCSRRSQRLCTPKGAVPARRPLFRPRSQTSPPRRTTCTSRQPRNTLKPSVSIGLGFPQTEGRIRCPGRFAKNRLRKRRLQSLGGGQKEPSSQTGARERAPGRLAEISQGSGRTPFQDKSFNGSALVKKAHLRKSSGTFACKDFGGGGRVSGCTRSTDSPSLPHVRAIPFRSDHERTHPRSSVEARAHQRLRRGTRRDFSRCVRRDRR